MSSNTTPGDMTPEVSEERESSIDQAAREARSEARRKRVERLDELAVSQSEADVAFTKAKTEAIKLLAGEGAEILKAFKVIYEAYRAENETKEGLSTDGAC